MNLDLRIQMFWYMMLCCQVSDFQSSFKTLGTSLNLQKCCENLKPLKL